MKITKNKMSDVTLAIIGTAGRKSDGSLLSLKCFEGMMKIGSLLIDKLESCNLKVTHIVSGGAAWADHVAVKLYLQEKVPNLILYLPAPFDNCAYHSGGNPYVEKTADTANFYHKKFQRTTYVNSLTDIQIAKEKGAKLYVVPGGFMARNTKVSESDILLAMTFGEKEFIKPGGTEDTVRKYLDRCKKTGCFNKSFHYNLSDGEIYSPAKVLMSKKLTLDDS